MSDQVFKVSDIIVSLSNCLQFILDSIPFKKVMRKTNLDDTHRKQLYHLGRSHVIHIRRNNEKEHDKWLSQLFG